MSGITSAGQLFKRGMSEFEARGLVSKFVGQDGGAQFHIRPRDEAGKIVPRGTKDAAGEPVHGTINFAAVDQTIGQAIQGLRHIGDDPLARDLEGVLQVSKAAQELAAKGKSNGDELNKIFNGLQGIGATNDAARFNVRGNTGLSVPEKRTTRAQVDRIRKDETQAELNARDNGAFVRDRTNGGLKARKATGEVAKLGRAMRARKAEAAAKAELEAAMPSRLMRIRAASGRDVQTQQIQSSQQ